jgi:hypothetical protein
MPRPAPRIPRAPIQHKPKPNDRLRPKHVAWIKTLPCIRCGRTPCDPAHVRIGNTGGGTSLKPPDRFTVPLCSSDPLIGYEGCHAVQHQGEMTFWAELGVDPVDIALRLWAVTGDTEQALRTITRARQAIALHRREHA